MNISSLVVRTRPDRAADVRAALAALPGIEVTAATDAGQLVVVADHDRAETAADSFVAMHRIEGVLSVLLVYQYSDDVAVPEEV